MSRDRWLGVELRHFAALAAIAREGSFRGAADHLGYAQSAVSQQLASLEKLVGARLVERSRGAAMVGLTPAGEALLHHAGEMLARVQAAKADIAGLADGSTLRVGAFQSVATRMIPGVLAVFSREWPDVHVTFGEWATDEPVLELVADGTLDLGFGWLPPAPGPFAHRELLETPLVLLAAADSPLARSGEPPTLGEIARHPLIGCQTCRVLAWIEDQLRAAAGPLDVVVRSDLNETVQSLAASGLGVALIPRLAVDEDADDLAIVELGDQLPPVGVGLVWHRDRLLSPAARAFGDAARTVCDAAMV
jgi:molybdate transport repressor ModE-like protein